MLCSAFSAAFPAYAAAHPNAVNQGMSGQDVESSDIESFNEVSDTDYHNLTEEEYAPNEIILEIISSSDNTTSSLSSFEDKYDLKFERLLRTDVSEDEDASSLSTVSSKNAEVLISTYFMSTENDNIIELCDELNEYDEVFNAQPNYKYTICEETEQIDMTPDAEITAYTEPPAFSTDGYINNLQWWFDYTNISSGWSTYADSSTGYGMGAGVTVAVIDTGCNTAHEDIQDNLWTNSKGYCGYYAYESSYISIGDSSMDQNSHGSHCCGTIAMNGNNSVGGIGTAPQCDLMVLKADRNTGAGVFYDSELITSLEKAVEFGADIVSMSLGGYNFSYATYRTYQTTSSSCIICCAAGNDKFDTTEKLHFPSAASCVIGVMATGNSSHKDKLATFSNYDTTGNFYKVAAPGTNIWSLNCNGTDDDNASYGNKSGTSMATPATAGMIASYMSYIRGVKGWDWTPAQYQYKIESVINASGNSLSCTAYSNSYHPVAYEKGSQFKMMNLKYLFSNSQSNTFSSVSTVAFNNSDIQSGVKKATGYSDSELDKYALMRVSLMYWTLNSNRQKITDYSDLENLPGLNYLDLSGSKVTQDIINTVIGYLPASLVYLDLTTSSDLTDISALARSKVCCLHYFDFGENAITNIGFLSKFTSLKYLYMDNNNITDISALSKITHIEQIYANNNSIQDALPALASPYLNTLNLSYNKLTDYTQLNEYKGAYVSSSFKSSTITINVSNNYMPGLTATIVDEMKSTIEARNTVSGEVIATTINIIYDNQTTPSTSEFIPMTSYSIANTTVSRENFCSGMYNLNSYLISSFSKTPSNANQYSYLSWECEEDGYCTADGTITVNPEEITSTRIIKFTATAPEGSSATSNVTGTKSQSIFITITAPEIYNAYLSDRVTTVSGNVKLMVSANQYTSQIVLRSGTSATATTIATYDTSAANYKLTANEKCQTWLVTIPTSYLSSTGTKYIYVYPADSNGVFSVGSSIDISGRTTYAYKYPGALYVKDSPDTGSTLTVTTNQYITRYGESAIFACNSGTSAIKPSGSYGFTITEQNYIGGGIIYTSYGSGYSGVANSSKYPYATTGTSSINLKLTTEDSQVITASGSVTTIAPEVKDVACNNADTATSDGYYEYTVKTNHACTGIKAVDPLTKETIVADAELIISSYSSSSPHGYYSSSYSRCWKIQIPLSGSNPQAATIVGYDELGDGTVTKTPATGITIPTSLYFYPNQLTSSTATRISKNLKNYVTVLPVDSEGNSLADCCNTVTFSTTSTNDYISISGSYAYCDYDAFSAVTTTSTSILYKATVNGITSSSGRLYASKPVVDSLSYDADQSIRMANGTVYYTARTYSCDTIYIRESSSKTADVVASYTLADTDHYTEGVNENGETYIDWNFTRKFDSAGTKLVTYVRGTYTYKDTTVLDSTSYRYLAVAVKAALGDYSKWNEQTERFNLIDKTALQALYGERTDEFNTRLKAVEDYIAEANMFLSVDEQETIDSMTAELTTLIDDLLGYEDFQTAVERYHQMIDPNPDYYYIPERLTELIALTPDDSNAEAVAAEINKILDSLEGSADMTKWNTALSHIPKNLDSVFEENNGYYIYSPDSRANVNAASVLSLDLPAPSSKQQEIDDAAAVLEQTVSELSANKIDVTILQQAINNQQIYLDYFKAYTLPDNLESEYLSQIELAENQITAYASQAEADSASQTLTEIINKIDEFIGAVNELNDYMTFLSSDEQIPYLENSELQGNPYSEETYNPLKEKYDEAKEKLANQNAGFTSLEAVVRTNTELQELYNNLHKHAFDILIAETCVYKYMQCVCGEYKKTEYASGETVPGHSWGEDTVLTDNFCGGTTSITYHQCTVCGCIEYTDGEEVLAGNHTWVKDEELSKAPACIVNGSDVYKCSVCGALKSEDIAPLNHQYSGEWKVTVKPTETSEGEEINECIRCGIHLSRPISVLPSRANLIIPFSPSDINAEKLTVTAYSQGASFLYDEPLFTFTSSEDEYGYKITTDESSGIMTVRLPQDASYDIVIQMSGYTSFRIYNIVIETEDYDIRNFNDENHDNECIAVLHPGDVNADGVINALDKIELTGRFAEAISTENNIFDINNDQIIDSSDKTELLTSYMKCDESFAFPVANKN